MGWMDGLDLMGWDQGMIGLTTHLAEDSRTLVAVDDLLRVGEDSCDLNASRALHILCRRMSRRNEQDMSQPKDGWIECEWEG